MCDKLHLQMQTVLFLVNVANGLDMQNKILKLASYLRVFTHIGLLRFKVTDTVVLDLQCYI